MEVRRLHVFQQPKQLVDVPDRLSGPRVDGVRRGRAQPTGPEPAAFSWESGRPTHTRSVSVALANFHLDACR